MEDAATADPTGVDIALFSGGAAASRELAPRFAAAGAVVIDNSSAWRMDPEVPLVVPEVNAAALDSIPKGIVANPNCTTMVGMPVLKPLHDAAGLVGLVVSTYQAVSGAGLAGVAELDDQLLKTVDGAAGLTFDGNAVDFPSPVTFPDVIAHNVLPLAGSLVTTVPARPARSRSSATRAARSSTSRTSRSPAPASGSRCSPATRSSIVAEFERPLSPGRASELLAVAPGVELSELPTPLRAAGRDPSLVGRSAVGRRRRAGGWPCS